LSARFPKLQLITLFSLLVTILFDYSIIPFLRLQKVSVPI
jgi:hypothetical protein